MPSIEFISKDKKTGRVKFFLKDSNPGFANALRRLMMADVPVMAIKDVEISKNSSPLYDEIIAHRLGLVPLTTDLKGYKLPSACKCDGKGCAQCQTVLSLKARGPAAVLAKELKSKDPAIKPVYPDMPIARLLKGQELEIVATATLGVGKEHVKWSPCLAWYIYKPKVTVNNNHPKFAEFKSKYPPQAFANDKLSKERIEELDLYDAVEGINPDIVNVEYDQNAFLFYLEPWGQLSPKVIVTTALDALSAQLAELESTLG